MPSIKQLCIPRPVIFDPQKRDTVLDLNDLVADRIDPAAFFEENFITEGMQTLLKYTFDRLEGRSAQGVFKLRQAMGGGKTHNLLALGLLARHPEYRQRVMGQFYTPDPALGPVKVIAFSGRESDAPLGLWGALAEQLGKLDHFKDTYTPLRAPGQKAWENLFAGESLLILLDELPPYFQSARAIAIGNSDLSQVTATALSNLLIALGRESCDRVAVVITDLAASYQVGSAQISEVLSDLEKETNRSAMSLEPVRLNSDELYHILRKRIFEEMPTREQIKEIGQSYAAALRKGREMELVAESPEEFGARVETAYPFHPGIRDLYARFRENPGFQQTRGLIRLMRLVTANLWTSGKADERDLIGAQDVDLNDQQIRAEIGQINSTLDNAIAHDIAADGGAVAEGLDANYGSTDASEAARLLLMSSLANVPNAVRGLAIPEAIAYLARPGRDLSRLKSDVLPSLATQAWYLHGTRDGKLYFRHVENINAKLESYVKNYVEEQAVRELRERLGKLFAPQQRDVYQKMLLLPAIDEIGLEQDQVTLVIAAPYSGGLNPDLRKFYDDTTWKNRIAILTGPINTYQSLLTVGRRLRAIAQIDADLIAEGLPVSDPQRMQAAELTDRIVQSFHSAVRETFTTLWYPSSEGLMSADLTMQFRDNRYDGEEQIRTLLLAEMKFTDKVGDETFRTKCERRLFTQQSMRWGEIKRRAATNTTWQWHLPTALDTLKERCLFEGAWREQDGYVEKGPFPQPGTSVTFREVQRDADTGETLLRVTPVHGDTIYWEVGGQATTASAKLDGNELSTSELRVSFLCVDSRGAYETGEPVTWSNRVTLKYRLYQRGEDKMIELRAAPLAQIRYTTDGSDPKLSGASYDGDFAVPPGAAVVLAYAERDGIVSETLRVTIDWGRDEGVKVDPQVPARYKREQTAASTQETYSFLDMLDRYHGLVEGLQLTIGGQGGVHEWLELASSEQLQTSPEQIKEALSPLRNIQTEGQVQLTTASIYFATGQDLLDWVAERRLALYPGDVVQ